MTKQTASIERFTKLMFTRIVTGLATVLAEEEFTIAQIAALHLLDQSPEMRVLALAEVLGRSPSATSRLVDSLVKRGLVTRVEHAEDRRAKLLSLTAAGTRLVERISQDRAKVILGSARSLPVAMREDLAAALTKR